VQCDEKLPASLEQLCEQGAGCCRIVEQPTGCRGYRCAGALRQRLPYLAGYESGRRFPNLGQLAGDCGTRPGRDRAEKVRGPSVPRGKYEQRLEVQLGYGRPDRIQPRQVIGVPLRFQQHAQRRHSLPQRRYGEPRAGRIVSAEHKELSHGCLRTQNIRLRPNIWHRPPGLGIVGAMPLLAVPLPPELCPCPSLTGHAAQAPGAVPGQEQLA
jgi:hypothetical protein